MRVLVIGGTGLISSAIVERLLETGHEPILFNRGKSPKRYPQDVEIVIGDRQDFAAFEAKAKQIRFDAVIDMITFTPETAQHAVEVFRDRVDQYLFCSTVCVYGGPLTKVPADEEEPHTPVSEYGRAKSAAEAVFQQAHEENGFPVAMFRPSHCYGPGQPLLDIFGYNASLVNRIREGRPILVPGDGFGPWQPGYIGDVAKGFVGALGRKATLGKAYNIVGDEIMDWYTFHARMAKAIGHEATIVPMTTGQITAGTPEPAASMLVEIFQYPAAYTNDRLKTDVPEFTDLLPWEEGVRRTVAWMDENKVHQPIESMPWIDTLALEARKFEKTLREKRPAQG